MVRPKRASAIAITATTGADSGLSKARAIAGEANAIVTAQATAMSDPEGGHRRGAAFGVARAHQVGAEAELGQHRRGSSRP